MLALTGVDGAALVDGASAGVSAALLKAVAALPGAGTIHTLFNTHWHPEQTGLNETLGKAGATIIAQENTRLWLTTDVTWPWSHETVQPLPKGARPNKTFYSRGELAAGGKHIEYGHLRDCPHTDGDMYVFLPDANVLAVGGALSGDGWQLPDWWTGGWIGGLVGGLQHLLKIANADTRIVPARGPVLSRAELQRQYEMYNVVWERLAQAAIHGARAGRSRRRESDQRVRRRDGQPGRVRGAVVSKSLGLSHARCLIEHLPRLAMSGVLMQLLTTKRVALGCALALVAGCGKFDAESRAAAEGGEQWQLVKKYCVECHNDTELAGELSFDKMGPESVAANAEAFEKAVRKLRGHLMPPPKEPRPDEQQLYSFVSWLEGSLDKAAANRVPERITLQRLNRKEYANAVHDLLDLDIDAADAAPAGRARRRLRQHRERAAGVAVVHRAIHDRGAHGCRAGRGPARCAARQHDVQREARHAANAPAGSAARHARRDLGRALLPIRRRYEINIADMAGHIWGNDMEFENTVLVTLDSKEIYRTVIGGDKDMKRYDQEPAGAFDAINAGLKNINFRATAGPHKLGVTFLRRTYAESDDRIEIFVPGGGQDRIYRVSSFQVSGPFNASGLSADAEPRAHLHLPSRRAAMTRSCARRRSSRRSATRAFRRPLAETDLQKLLRYYRDGSAAGGFEEGIRSAITGILASPNFLYRGERVPADLDRRRALQDRRSRARLEALVLPLEHDSRRRAARHREPRRAQQAGRAQGAGAPNARRPARRDARQQLRAAVAQHGALGRGRARPRRLSVRLRQRRSAQRLHDRARRCSRRASSTRDRSVLDLMTADHTYVNERVALLYGITA